MIWLLEAYRRLDSIRAYKMRFDDWDLRKHGSSRGFRARSILGSRPHHHEISPSSAATPPRSPPREPSPSKSDDLFLEQLKLHTGVEIPRQPITAQEMLNLLDDYFPCAYSLETILFKWQDDGAYLKMTLKYLAKNPSSVDLARPTLKGATLTKLIDESVGTDEKVALTKACLKASLDIEDTPWLSPRASDLSEGWRQARWYEGWKRAANTPWETSKKILYDQCYEPQILGERFFECTFMVIAERRLGECKHRLDNFCEPFGDKEASRWRRDYMGILKDFRHAKLDNSSWYTYAFQFIEWEESEPCQNTLAHKENPHFTTYLPNLEIFGVKNNGQYARLTPRY